MRSTGRVRRAPIVTFAGVEVLALVAWLRVGRSSWFYIDEWDVLAGRRAGDLGDLFRSHNGHWTTLPVLAFRLLYALFGLRSYLPYRMLVIVLYLACAALLLVVMRRAGVDPWIATAAASLFALFGAGWENAVLPFQITFMGSFAFGLVYLLVADHDGPFDRRDWLGLGAGLLALMCSAVGLVMVAVVTGAVLLRRGWQPALRHVAPLAVCYVVWQVGARASGDLGHLAPGEAVRFVATGFRAAFGALGPFAAFGIALAALLIAGGALAFGQRQARGDRAGVAAPAALLAGALALLVITAVNRSSFGPDWARQSRYVSLVAAMTLPALAVAADAVARCWRAVLPLAVAVFLVGIPANLHAATRAQRFLKSRDAVTRAMMLSLPRDPLARAVPRSVRPEPTTATAVTIGWLLDAREQGRLPAGPAPAPRLLASDDFRLSFVRTSGAAPTNDCRDVGRPVVVSLHKGDQLGVAVNAVYLEPAARTLIGLALLYPAAPDAPITALRDVGPVRIIRLASGPVPRVCVGRA